MRTPALRASGWRRMRRATSMPSRSGRWMSSGIVSEGLALVETRAPGVAVDREARAVPSSSSSVPTMLRFSSRPPPPAARLGIRLAAGAVRRNGARDHARVFQFAQFLAGRLRAPVKPPAARPGGGRSPAAEPVPPKRRVIEPWTLRAELGEDAACTSSAMPCIPRPPGAGGSAGSAHRHDPRAPRRNRAVNFTALPAKLSARSWCSARRSPSTSWAAGVDLQCGSGKLDTRRGPRHPTQRGGIDFGDGQKGGLDLELSVSALAEVDMSSGWQSGASPDCAEVAPTPLPLALVEPWYRPATRHAERRSSA